MADDKDAKEGVDTGQEPTAEGQAPKVPTEAPGADTFDREYVEQLRSEAAERRTELRKAQEQLKKLQQAQEAAERQQLEEQGKHKDLYERTSAEYTDFKSRARRRVLEVEMKSRLRAARVPEERIALIRLPVDQVSLNDDLTIEGDVEAALQPLIEAFGPSEPARNGKATNGQPNGEAKESEPKQKTPATVVSETTRHDNPPPGKKPHHELNADWFQERAKERGFVP